MSADSLETKLDNVLKEFCDAAVETRNKFYSDSTLHEALVCVYDDVYRCLSEFEKAIVEFEKQKD